MTPTAKQKWLGMQKDQTEQWFFRQHPSAVRSLDGRPKVLQQWWAVERNGQITPQGEWRDIPVEEA